MAKRFFNFSFLSFMLYLAVVFILLQQVLAQGTGHLVGKDYLGSLSYWVTWWAPYAFHHNFDLVYNSYNLYPIKSNVLLVLSLPTSAVYFLLNRFFTEVQSYNLILPLYQLFNAWFTALLLKQFIKNPWVCLVGGLIFAFNPVTYTLAARGEIPLLGLFVLPACIWVWELSLRRQNALLYTLLPVVVLYIALLMSFQFINLIIITFVPYVIYRRHALSINRVVVQLLLLLLLVAIYPLPSFLWSTYPMDFLDETSRSDEDLFIPEGKTQYAPLENWQAGFELDSLDDWRAYSLLGLLVVAVSFALPADFTQRRLWGAVFILSIILIIHPEWSPASVAGVLFQFPRNPQLTQPTLYVLPAILGGYSLLALALDNWTVAGARRALVVGAVAAVALFFSGWQLRLPMSDLPPLDTYRSLASESDPYTIIEHPIVFASLSGLSDDETYIGPLYGEVAGRVSAYIPLHHKQVVGGLTTYLYQEQIDQYYRSYLMRTLLFLPIDEAPEEFVPILKSEVLRWRIGYVALYPDIVSPDFTAAVRSWLAWTGAFCYVTQEQGIEFWRSTWHPAGCPDYQIQLGSPAGALAIGSGWQETEFLDEMLVRRAIAIAQLTLWVDRPQSDYDLLVKARTDGDETQTVDVYTGTYFLGTLELKPAWNVYQVMIPREQIEDGGLLRLELWHSSAAPSALYESIVLHPIDANE